MRRREESPRVRRPEESGNSRSGLQADAGESVMLPENRIPTHPGVILLEEFLKPMGMTQVALSDQIGVPTQRVNEIAKGKRGVTPETAWLFAQAFGTTPQFWLNLQASHDLARSRPEKDVRRLKAVG